MREILFRGKRVDNGKWVEGAFLHLRVGRDYICDGSVWIGTLQPYKEQVDTKTVGQYTGLLDKNGKKVFEGDIVKNEYRKGQYQYFKIVYDTRVYCWQVENKYGMLGFLYNVIGDLEVIGNIYDNPELLEVK